MSTSPSWDADAVPQIRRTRVCLVVVLGLMVPTFLPKLFVHSYGTSDLRAIPLMLAFGAPWMVSLLMLSVPRLRHPGLALAASASIVALVPLVPLMALNTLFAGFMQTNQDQWLSYYCRMGMMPVLIVLAVQATRGALRVPETARSAWGWPVGAWASIAYALLLSAVLRGIGP